jgi:hypothetical protein
LKSTAKGIMFGKEALNNQDLYVKVSATEEEIRL